MNVQYYTLGAGFNQLGQFFSFHNITKQVEAWHELDRLPKLNPVPLANASGMADKGAGWLLIRIEKQPDTEQPPAIFWGWNSNRQLDENEVFTIQEIARLQEIPI